MSTTDIEWTDKVWNPVTGCTKVSQGCKNCYAEGIADRFFAKQYPPNADGSLRQFTDVRCHEDRLDQPLHWKKPARIFVNSMSDLFHEDVPENFIRAVFAIMRTAQQHTFQILTKRPERMREILAQWQDDGLVIREGWGCVLPNVWLGVSVEDQKTADERIPLLLQTPAAVRWVSYEPALGPVDFGTVPHPTTETGNVLSGIYGTGYPNNYCTDRKIDWLVCGGESGPGARPMHPDLARSVRDQCKAAGVPFFFKQWGEWIAAGQVVERPTMDRKFHHWDDGAISSRVGKASAGRLLDGEEHSEYPA